jgi:hypothetical protein
MNKARLSILILVFSGVLLTVGFFQFEKYKFTAGQQVQAPARFPAALNARLDTHVPTLLLFAHPKCTCTEATIAELGRLKEKLGSKIAVRVYVSYDQKDYSPEHEEIENTARKIANIEVEKDPDRIVAKEFGALTSGQTVLYAPEGNLMFQGGITESRGHEGDNPGVREITRIVSAPFIKNSYGRFPTFGCHL